MTDEFHNTETRLQINTFQNRVLVLGTRMGGAFDLGDELELYMINNGVSNTKVEVLRDAGQTEFAFNGGPNRLPLKGVILLPEMRQYDQSAGMSFDSYESGYADDIQRLCDEKGIPLVQIKANSTKDQLSEGLKQILPGK